MTVRHKKVLTQEEEKHNREEAAKLLFRTLTVNHPKISMEACFKIYDLVKESEKNGK